jgi:hypothetical protein
MFHGIASGSAAVGLTAPLVVYALDKDKPFGRELDPPSRRCGAARAD